MFKIKETHEKGEEVKTITYDTPFPDLFSGESIYFAMEGWELVLREVEKVVAE